MKSYLVVYDTEYGERGSVGGTGTYETSTLVRYKTDDIARKKILDRFGAEGVKVYHLTKRLRLSPLK